MNLYRPTGLIELRLIYESGLKSFPPRLPNQPIFYPVLNFDYAYQIAFKWNSKSEPYVGFVTEFEIDESYFSQFKQHIVGGQLHKELWIFAENLDEFNHNIIGQINLIEACFGEKYKGFRGKNSKLKDKDAIEQFILMAGLYDNNRMDFHSEIIVNNEAIFLNYPFWQRYDYTNKGIDKINYDRTLEAIMKSWTLSFPDIPLGIV